MSLPMTWMLVALDAVPPQAWRNGGGRTRELLAWPSADEWSVRLSVADVEADGPFSAFPGIERWFAVLEGGSVVLGIGGVTQHVGTDAEPLRFNGAVPVSCRVPHGPTRDFNVMAKPGRARLRRIRGEGQVATKAGLVAAYTHAAPATLRLDGADFALPPRHLAWRLHGTPLSGTVQGDDLLWMEAQA